MVRITITNSLGVLHCYSTNGWIAQRLALIWPFRQHPIPEASKTESVINSKRFDGRWAWDDEA